MTDATDHPTHASATADVGNLEFLSISCREKIRLHKICGKTYLFVHHFPPLSRRLRCARSIFTRNQLEENKSMVFRSKLRPVFVPTARQK